MPKIEVDVVGDVSSLGRELRSGASQVRGFQGQLRDANGQFAKAGSGAGAGFLGGFRSKLGGGGGAGAVLKGVLGAGLIEAGIGGALEGLRQFSGLLEESVGEARESQKVGATTAQVIKATGGAAKISADQVGDLATRLSNKSGIDDEVIQSGSNLLLTFKNVRNEAGKGANVFDRATAAAVDLSAAGFGSVAGGSKMLGKALNDPVKGISALSRAGVTFTDQQKKTIGSLVKSGDVLGAQKIILGEVEHQVGGVAAANATAGEKAKVLAGNLKEQLGTALLPTLDKLEGFFVNKLGPAISTGLDKVPGIITTITGLVGPVVSKLSGIGTSLAAGLTGGGGITGFIAQLQPLGTTITSIIATVGPALLGIATQVGGLVQTILPTLTGLATSIGGVLQAVLPGVLGVVSSLVGAVKTFIPIVLQVVGSIVAAIQANLPALLSAFESIKSTVSSVVSIVISVWSRLGPVILPILTNVFGTIIQVISGALRIVAGIFKVISSVLKGDWSGAWNGIKQIVAGVVQIVLGIVRGLAASMATVFGKILSVASSIWSAIKGAASSAWSAIVGVVKSKTESVLATVRAIPGRIKGALSNLGSLLLGSGKALLDGLAQGIRNGISSAIGAAKDAVSSVRAFFPFSPAKRGPFSGSGWTLYSGRAIGAALGQGMLQSRREVTRSADALADAAAIRTAVVGVRPVAPNASRTAVRTPASLAVAQDGTGPVGVLSDDDIDRLASAFAAQLKVMDPRGEHALVRRAQAFAKARGGTR